MKTTLQANGQASKTTQQTTTAKVAKKLTEDEWFEVKPQAIDQNLFEKKRKSIRQEIIRQIILEAFAEMKDNPEKYGKNFKSMIPKKTWYSKTVGELKEMASNLGDHNADWVELALEWAQRIANGESWKSICNDKDTANWYRLVVWKNGVDYLVGGSVCCEFKMDYPKSYVHSVNSDDYFDSGRLECTVPLVVRYE